MGLNRTLPCPGRIADLGGNVGGSHIDDRAFNVAELFFELAIREYFEPLNYIVHVEYGFGGPMARNWVEDRFVLFAGRHPLVEKIHEALLTHRNKWRRPAIGKADFLLIPADGRTTCGVIEVGALRQLGRKKDQVGERVAQLEQTMRLAPSRECRAVRWRAEPWRPAWPPGKRASDPFGEEAYYICAEPTWRVYGGRGAPPGVLLYEVHRLLRDRRGQQMSVPAAHMEPLATDLFEWLRRHDGHPATTLARGRPEEIGREAVTNNYLRLQMNRTVALYGAAAVVAGVAALMLSELGPIDAPLIAAAYKFVEAAAAAAH